MWAVVLLVMCCPGGRLWSHHQLLQTTMVAAAAIAATALNTNNSPSPNELVQHSTGCPDLCLKCGPKGCIKCPTLITYGSRQCVDQCPDGRHVRPSTMVDYMGMVCMPPAHGRRYMFGFTMRTWSVISGIVCGLFLSSILVSVTLLYLHHAYRKRCSKFPQQHSHPIKGAGITPTSTLTTTTTMPTAMGVCRPLAAHSESASSSSINGDDITSAEQYRDFVKQVEILRPHAYTFLDMLNDTRRQVRNSRRDGGVLAAYRPVLRDLAKILLILNRYQGAAPTAPPADWHHLFAWCEKVLDQYRSTATESIFDDAAEHQQVAQLVTFLQGTNDKNICLPGSKPDASCADDHLMANLPKFSTFRPGSQEPAKTNYFDNTSSTTASSSVGVHLPSGTHAHWLSFDYDSLLSPSSRLFGSASGSVPDSGTTSSAGTTAAGATATTADLWLMPQKASGAMFVPNRYRNQLFDDDDVFNQLGFRPQDEITTEL